MRPHDAHGENQNNDMKRIAQPSRVRLVLIFGFSPWASVCRNISRPPALTVCFFHHRFCGSLLGFWN